MKVNHSEWLYTGRKIIFSEPLKYLGQKMKKAIVENTRQKQLLLAYTLHNMKLLLAFRVHGHAGNVYVEIEQLFVQDLS